MDISETELEHFRSIGEQAARAGGERLMNWMGKITVQEKGPGDLVTQADFESQQVIREFLFQQFPDHQFLGEENDGSLEQLITDGFCWIVDPLDGTTNFVHQMYSFSVSVALAYKGEIIAGCVFDPWLKECFTAAKGLGATLNGNPIRTSICSEGLKALLVCSFSMRVSPDSAEVKRFINLMANAGSIRRLGSAALNFCYVACGRLDGYWATSVSIWDVAAGLIILTESGGVAEHIDGQPFDLNDPRFLATANDSLQDNLRPYMSV